MGIPGDELVNPVTAQTIRFLEEGPEALVLESSYRAGGPPAPAHYHPAQGERFEVLSGAVRAVLGGRERTLREGDTVTVPAGTRHEFGGHPGEDGRVRWEIRPPMKTARFLRTTFGLARDGKVSPKTGVPGLLQAAVIAQEYADEFRLVKPPRPTQVVLFAVLAPLGRLRGLRGHYPEYGGGA